MRVKVCGMRQPENITEVAGLGVDYLGLIFHPGSSRFVDDPSLGKWIDNNKEILKQMELVGVFVNAEVDYVLNTVHDYHLDWVQLHGSESAGYCQELKLLWSVNTLRKAKICKAFSITPDFDFRETDEYVSSCSMFVFDTGGQTAPGGTGQKWDWSKIAEYTGPVPFLLSGGIGPDDAAAVQRVNHKQLRGVDLNSRFEKEPAVKDVQQLRVFMNHLRKS